MKFKLIIDKCQDEEVVATVHNRTPLIDEIEALICKYTDRIPGYTEDDIKLLTVSQIECVTVLDGKTYAIDSKNQPYRLKQRPLRIGSRSSPVFYPHQQKHIGKRKRSGSFCRYL